MVCLFAGTTAGHAAEFSVVHAAVLKVNSSISMLKHVFVFLVTLLLFKVGTKRMCINVCVCINSALGFHKSLVCV